MIFFFLVAPEQKPALTAPKLVDPHWTWAGRRTFQRMCVGHSIFAAAKTVPLDRWELVFYSWHARVFFLDLKCLNRVLAKTFRAIPFLFQLPSNNWCQFSVSFTNWHKFDLRTESAHKPLQCHLLSKQPFSFGPYSEYPIFPTVSALGNQHTLFLHVKGKLHSFALNYKRMTSGAGHACCFLRTFAPAVKPF